MRKTIKRTAWSNLTSEEECCHNALHDILLCLQRYAQKFEDNLVKVGVVYRTTVLMLQNASYLVWSVFKIKIIIISRAKVHITAANNGNVHFNNLTKVGLKTGAVGQSESS